MTQYSFGIGACIAKRTDLAVLNSYEFGTLQEVSVDISFTIKELMGQFQAPAALARGGMKITGKSKAALINSQSFNNVFFGQTGTSSVTLFAYHEAGTPSTNTLTVANSATFAADWGVTNAATGVRMTRVASGPTAGQYSVNESTGVYTFASADNNPAVLVSYTYTSAQGKTISITNQLMGSAPTFSLILSETYNGKILNLQLNSCISPKLTLSFKNEDWTIPEFDFQASADSSGNIGSIWFSE